MAKSRAAMVVLITVAALGAGGFGYRYYVSQQRSVPPGIAFSNGRIEANEIEIATKYASRVAEIRFEEGDLVNAGQVLSRMDTKEFEAAEHAAAATAEQKAKDLSSAQSAVTQRKAEVELAVSELNRARTLVARDAISQQRVEQLSALQQSAEAALASAKSQVAAGEAAVVAAKSEQERLQHMISDATLVAPKPGRILYKLAEVGETLPAGGQVATMLDLSEVYMTFFLNSEATSKLALNAEGRIVVDAAPDRAIPGFVSYISPRAQFTPKQVEVKSERERMMSRIKLRIPEALVEQYVAKIKTGVLGVAYVKLDPKAVWPSWLESDLTAVNAPWKKEK